MKFINAAEAYNMNTGYSQAVETEHPKRMVFVSGQIPVAPDGSVPESFEDQARQTWANVEMQLRTANMTLRNIVRHTTYLSDRRYRPQNSLIRRELLAGHEAALTVIICDIFDEGWLLEIEAIAVE